ncbi:MAG: hypothetical protein R3D55_05800 [Chloroflexota bacterium]
MIPEHSMQLAAYQIARWLAQQVSDAGYPARSFYGEPFSLWLWQFFPGEFVEASQKLHPLARQQLQRQDVAAHPEFNAYALLRLCQQSGDSIQSWMPTLPRFNNTPNSNWLLLGTLVRLLWAEQTGENQPNWRLRWHTRLLLAMQQQADGLIRDDRLISRRLPVPFGYGRSAPLRLQKMPHLQKLSLQYHCFSLLLLWEIWQRTGWPFVQTAVHRGYQAIGRFMLGNGDTLYIGRGQQQIFGYGSLLNLLANLAASGNAEAGEQMAKVWSFVKQYQQEDGRFPLVLSDLDNGYTTKNTRPLGWYSYNNLFDYLPFLGVQLAQAAQTFSPEAPPEPSPQKTAIHATRQYALIHQPDWQMALAAPGGALSQDQPMPYLCLHGQSLLPCFGGEAGDDEPYQLTMLPLPYLGLANGHFIFLRQAMQWQFAPYQPQQPILLRGRCAWGSLSRQVSWEANKIIIQDSLHLRPAKLPQGISTLYPLVFTAFSLEWLANGRYQIHPAPCPTYLTLTGQEGNLETIPAYTPVGPAQTVRETMPFSLENDAYNRRYTINWAEDL